MTPYLSELVLYCITWLYACNISLTLVDPILLGCYETGVTCNRYIKYFFIP